MIDLYPDDKTVGSKVSAATLARKTRPYPDPVEMYPWHPPPPLTAERLLEISLSIRASVKYISIQPYPNTVKDSTMTNGDDVLRFKPYQY
jgi:hypothetical protein